MLSIVKQTRNLLRYSLVTFNCTSAIFYRRSMQWQPWCKITFLPFFLSNRECLKSGSTIDRQEFLGIALISYSRIILHFYVRFLILPSISFLHIELVCFLVREDVYRMKFTRCIFKTPAGFERAALTGREEKNHWWCYLELTLGDCCGEKIQDHSYIWF